MPPSEAAVARPPVETLVFKAPPQSPYAAVLSELWSMIKSLSDAPEKRRLIMIASTLIGILIVNMVAQVYLNRWQGRFYRALEKKDLDLILYQLIAFTGLIAVLLTVVVSQTLLHERFKIRLRQALTHRLLDQWLAPGRAYRLSISADEAVNPDQRIQEDVRNFGEMSADLSIGLIQSSFLLISFIGVLWIMSQKIYFDYHGSTFQIPGYMVWIAVIYALIGSLVTARVGRPLIALNEERYAQEAGFRFSIVRVSESSESVAFYSGEEDERKLINHSFDRVLSVMVEVSSALAKLTWVTSGYGWVMIVLPIMVALPGFLHGSLDLGGLMMVVGAFNQVQQSLRWFVDNFARIADWRAALHRVVVFRDAIQMVDEYENQTENIELLLHPEGHLSFEATKVSLIDGEVVIADATAHIHPGERVLIVGESGSGKSTLFRAVGGLWPWGSGIIRVPPKEDMMFLPQRPYMPLGTLAQALNYPKTALNKNREAMEEALTRVNLADFIKVLDVEERWDRLLSLGQQQRLAFARLLLHKPKWVFLDEATSALDDENQDRVMSLFTQELNQTTILSIGHRQGLAAYHTRSLQLASSQAGTILRRRRKPVTRVRLWRRAARRLVSRI